MNTTAWPEGIKKTKQREAIWSVLTTTDKPITALEIAERLGNGSTTCHAVIIAKARAIPLLQVLAIKLKIFLIMLKLS